MLALDLTYLMSIWLEVLLYGMFFPIWCVGMYTLFLMNKRDHKINPVLLVASVIMFILATGHLGLNAARLLIAFIWQRDAPGGPLTFLGDVSQPTQISKDVLYATQSLVGDAFAIYRAWVIWDRRLMVVAVPIALFLASTVSATMVSYLFTRVPVGGTLFDNSLYSWIMSFYAMALIQNVLTTSLLAYRIWMSERRLAQARATKTNSLMGIVRIFVESAVLYVIWQLALLILYASSDPSQYIVLEGYPSVVGIVFMGIIARIGFHSQTSQRQNTGGPSHDSVPLDRIVITRHTRREEDASTLEHDGASKVHDLDKMDEMDEGEPDGPFAMSMSKDEWQH